MNKNPLCALITGASSGIGLALAHEFAKHGYNLILVARSAEKLEMIRKSIEELYKVDVVVIVQDLSVSNAGEILYDEVVKQDLIVNVLINNAGFANFGAFTDNPWKIELDLLLLSVVNLAQLCHLFGKDMAERGAGKILNVSSIAGFIPGPLMSTYYASKGFAILFSEALSVELADQGIQVSVLCAGRTDTSFKINGYVEKSHSFSLFPKMSAESVAQIAYRELMKRKRVIIPGIFNNVQVFLVKFIPHWILLPIAQYRLKHQ
jgi:short-subunit dehydrogenase